jgi:hypothetical protein
VRVNLGEAANVEADRTDQLREWSPGCEVPFDRLMARREAEVRGAGCEYKAGRQARTDALGGLDEAGRDGTMRSGPGPQWDVKHGDSIREKPRS